MSSINVLRSLLACVLLTLSTLLFATIPSGIVVLETDFGLKDGAVSAMKGVMYSVDSSLLISDLTHEIPPYNIWEGAYRLYQTAPYWPKGTVFVSVIDPGVGSHRHSIVAEANSGQYFVSPDNGLLTLIHDNGGIAAIREIDESKNRLQGSQQSYTFHGRDVYGYTAARLAAGKISFADVGPLLTTPLVKLSYQKAALIHNKLLGEVVIFDPQYGNAWTNIESNLTKKYGMSVGELYKVTIYHQKIKKYEGIIPFENTFSGVKKGKDLLYLNSLLNLAIGTNQGNFAQINQLGTGPGWMIEIERAEHKPVK